MTDKPDLAVARELIIRLLEGYGTEQIPHEEWNEVWKMANAFLDATQDVDAQ